MNEVIKKFEQLSEKTEMVLNETFDCRKVEPIYIEILNLIKSHPDCREQFVRKFIFLLKTGEISSDLIEFCMRELQWEEIKKAAELEISKTDDWRVISTMNHILEVYEKEWEHSDLYKYYSN
jgi:hypothetical protein